MKRTILAIDPGETTGYAIIDLDGLGAHVRYVWENKSDTLLAQVEEVMDTLAYAMWYSINITDVVVEDYRVYRSAAARHIGNRLYTAELIGALEVTVLGFTPPPTFSRLPAQKKQRWPEVRLGKHFPSWLELCSSEHAKDALQIGLAYAEKVGWKPVLIAS